MDPQALSQCFQYLPLLQEHLKTNGLDSRIQLLVPKPVGASHSLVFVCEVTSELQFPLLSNDYDSLNSPSLEDGVKVCEGRAPKKDESQELAARNLANMWRKAANQY